MKDEVLPDLRVRTKRFAIDVTKLCTGLPKSMESQVIGRQLIRSATSPGAQYREACRAKSDADLVSKLEGIIQELDETCYWLEILNESGIIGAELTRAFHGEADELIRMFVAGVRKTKARSRKC